MSAAPDIIAWCVEYTCAKGHKVRIAYEIDDDQTADHARARAHIRREYLLNSCNAIVYPLTRGGENV